ncbi:MAG: hypothetical protein RAK22_00870 [Nanoarchaeota archaeon]|nr:hypothetical protein [Nanoarchaeota archaeon]
MVKLVVNIKALPKDVSMDMNKLSDSIKDFLSNYGVVYKREIQPLAFGLSVILVTLIIDESLGTNVLEEDFKEFKDAEFTITDISRIVDFG